MTDTHNTQTAVDATKTPAEPGVAGNDAQVNGDELDTLLSEFDKTAAPPAAAASSPAQAAGTDDLKALADEVRGLRTERQQETFRRDMDVTIKNIRGDLSPEFFDDRIVEAWVDAEARADPRLSQAWNDRHTNPKGFQKVVDTLGRKFASKYGKLPDKQATDDREAVTAAVRGASTRAPEGQAPDYSKMNDREFLAEKDKLLG
jgi:hypothetical protein